MAAEVIERRAEIAGTQVVWREAEAQTAGPPILYVHGVPNSGAMWVPFLERTGGLAPDLPGFGRSDKSAGFDYSIAGYAAFLRSYVEHLALERLSLVVHDWGSVGLALAQEAPDLIDRLAIICAVPLLPGYRWHRIARSWRTPVLGELVMGFTTRWTIRPLMTRTGALSPETFDAFFDPVLADFDHGTQRAILRLYRASPPEVLAQAGERLGELKASALIAWGKRDPFIDLRFAHAYADALGGPARVEVIDGGGHWPWVERRDVVDLVASHLGA